MDGTDVDATCVVTLTVNGTPTKFVRNTTAGSNDLSIQAFRAATAELFTESTASTSKYKKYHYPDIPTPKTGVKRPKSKARK
jgi:hypothetical protein